MLNNYKKRVIILLIIIILIGSGCSMQKELKGEYIIGVYSSHSHTDSKLVIVDFEGNIIKTKKIKGRTVASIKEVNNKQFSILAIASRQRYIGDFNKLEKLDLDNVPVAQDFKNGTHVISYQNNLIEDFIEWNGKDFSTKRLDFEGYLSTVKIHEDSIYVICEKVEENVTFLYEVDIYTGNIINEVKLNTPTGHDIEFTENYIVIGSVNNIILMDKQTLEQTNKITPFSDPIKMLINNNELIVQYRMSNVISFFDINSFEETRRIEHAHLVDVVFLREGKIYVSSYDEKEQSYITEYDAETLKSMNRIKIPTSRTNYLLDFIVVSFEG